MFAVSQTDLKGKRKAFAAIEEHLLPSWPLAKAGIDAQTPLKPGSGVLVVHQNEVFYGLVVVLFERGGGKTPTHNFVDWCIAIDRLSRFVVQVYVPLGSPSVAQFYSPWVITPQYPSSAPPLASYLFLQAENLVLSLDTLCPAPTAQEFVTAGANGLAMFPLNNNFRDIMSYAVMHGFQLRSAVQLTLEASRKRKCLEPEDNDASVGTTIQIGKRSKA
ncbi:hypothetical protein QCA50_019589 [Cerrena zonata]|uniref:Uncharacterized protein n=1 Tax=Cerrena zonata TaxID=2478898 RepID=A0AAW0FJD5_9APHY